MAVGQSDRLIWRMRTSGPASVNPVTSGLPADPKRWLVVALISAMIVAVAHGADAWAWSALRDPRVYERDWGRMLRSAGFLPTWIIVAVALFAHDRGTVGARWRGTLMLLVPTAAGALAEVLKLLFRRLRPGEASPEYVFRSFAEGPFSNKGMGLPSSHMMVAMGAAVVLARLFPRVWWMWYLIAIGCGLTRVMAGAHYASDVAVAGVAAYMLGDALTRWGLRKRSAAMSAAQ